MTAHEAEAPGGGAPVVEQVLVVPRAVVLPGAGWSGFRPDGVAPVLDAVTRHGTFRPRPEMEQDPAWKQIIPYLVLRDGDRWFLMRRTTAGGDARLHDRWTIGIGGHLNPGDGDVEGGLRREWAEELDASFVPEFQAVGLINDDATAVGAVHLGVVFVADAAGRPVAIRETHKLTGAFATTDETAQVQAAMETWSQLTFEALR